MGLAAERAGWSAAGCWAERVAQRAERMDVRRRMKLEMRPRVKWEGRARSRQEFWPTLEAGRSGLGGWRREEPLVEDRDGLVWSCDEGVDEHGVEAPNS